jgi:hypothetical protein
LNYALALATPLIQTSFQAEMNILVIALVHVNPSLLRSVDIEILNALIAHIKVLLLSALQAGKRILQPIMSFLLTLPNTVLDKMRRHPLVSGLASLYALLTLVLGPSWPVGVALKIAGFGAKGVVLSECSFFLIA